MTLPESLINYFCVSTDCKASLSRALNDVEDGSARQPARQCRNVEIDSGKRLIFKHQPAQFGGIDHQHRASIRPWDPQRFR